MHQRLTDPATRVVARAQDEARGLNRDRIDTGHILLALIHEVDATASTVLRSLGVSRNAVLREIESDTSLIEACSLGPSVKYTGPAKNVFDLSLREALRLGDNSIGTEHILLAMIREHGTIATEVLARLSIDQRQVNQRLLLLRSADMERRPRR
jgi:ATP-dependent Clp protease ATP-binding subunit ClpC